jgi:hypothetical protein
MLTDLERTLLSARDIARCIREAATDDHETPETARIPIQHRPLVVRGCACAR